MCGAGYTFLPQIGMDSHGIAFFLAWIGPHSINSHVIDTHDMEWYSMDSCGMTKNGIDSYG